MARRDPCRREPVPDPSGKVLAKLRGKVLAKLSTKTPGKATRQLVLGRAVKLPGVRKSTVRCGHSLVTQGILPAAKLYWHLHYWEAIGGTDLNFDPGGGALGVGAPVRGWGES